jgi:hypothetical protein
MRKLVRWIAGLAGIAALAKLIHARPRTVPPLTPGDATIDDPAEELRRKLAEARAAAPDPAGATETTVTPDEPERSLEERRAEIHSRAQDAIDAMRNDAK